MSNVASETLETEQKIGAQTRPNELFATPKHHGPEGRTSPRSAPKKVSNVASETLETEQKIGVQTRPNDAAAAVAGAASPAAATGTASLQNVPFATPKHHGPEGRTSPRSAPKKCLTLRLKL